jgi:hypothetical protein
MYLELESSSNESLYDFCNYIIVKMQDYLQNSINENKLKKFNDYINSNKIVKFVDKIDRYVNCVNILIASTYNLIILKSNKTYIIKINPNANIPNTYAKFIDVVKLIDKGNMSLSSYPI